MKNLVRIVTPENGTTLGTKVFTADGSEIKNILAIEIKPMLPNGVVSAEITVCVNLCDIHAHPLLSLESLRAAAEAHGYRLEQGHLTLGDMSVKYR